MSWEKFAMILKLFLVVPGTTYMEENQEIAVALKLLSSKQMV